MNTIYIAQHKRVIILWGEDDAKQLWLFLKISYQWADNLQSGTMIMKNLQYNGIFNMKSFM